MESLLASENTTSAKLNNNLSYLINNTVTNMNTSEKMPKKVLADIYKDIKWLTAC
jgi:hypothetical protein